MKILNSEAIREIDRITCETQGIDSVQLMERAAMAVTTEIISRFLPSQKIIVFAGPGNNGGDALASARMLYEQGYHNLEVFLFNIKKKLSHDCEEERRRLITLDGIDFTEITREFNPPYLGPDYVVVDGLFGSGLNARLQGGFVSVARLINESGAFVISIDIPSGLFGEFNHDANLRDVVNANLTLALGLPRLAFFFEENRQAVGEWKILDIEHDAKALKDAQASFMFVDRKNVRPLIRPRNPFSGKRDYGSALIFAGSLGMMGAAVMCARSVLKCGAGLATVHSAACGLQVLQTAVPEAMFEPDHDENIITNMTLNHRHQVVVCGPGIRTGEATLAALEGLLKNANCPLILDADALNCIANKPSLLDLLPPQTVITPHVGEFDRLFGHQDNSELRLSKAIEIARHYNITIVIKGHYTATVRPTGRVYFNSTGNPGMATAGSGDVLAGVIGAFIAQGYRPDLAATLGVYVHGLAGDLAAQEIGEYGVVASDISDRLGRAIRTITSRD